MTLMCRLKRMGNLNTGNEQVTPGNIEAVSPSANIEEEVFSNE
ncbi:hypothetical protein Tco_0685280, partial [Tanacetum coccineum]